MKSIKTVVRYTMLLFLAATVAKMLVQKKPRKGIWSTETTTREILGIPVFTKTHSIG